MISVPEIISHLQRIARKNSDDFDFNVEIRSNARGALRYYFTCSERSDGHIFLSGDGGSLEEAINNACCEDIVSDACEGWGYTYVD